MTEERSFIITRKKERNSESESGYSSEPEDDIKRNNSFSTAEVLETFCKVIDSEGGELYSPSGTGYGVIIPQGALPPDKSVTITMTVYDRDTEVGIGERFITNMVLLEPSRECFLKPVEVILPHWGWLSGKEGKVDVMLSQNKISDENIKWYTPDNKEVPEVTLMHKKCSVFLLHFTFLTIILRDGSTINGIRKRIYPMVHPLDDLWEKLEVTLKVMNDDEALCKKAEKAAEKEGKYLADYSEILLHDNKQPLHISLSPIGEHLQLESPNNMSQTIPFSQLFHLTKNNLLFGVTNTRGKQVPKLVFHYDVAQPGAENKKTESFSILMQKIFRSENKSSHSDADSEDETEGVIPYSVQCEVCALLNKESPTGEDWRMLAEVLGLWKYISRWEGKPNPTKCVLQAAYQRQTIPSIEDLVRYLKRINREDAASVVAKSIKATTFTDILDLPNLRTLSHSTSGYETDTSMSSPSPTGDENINVFPSKRDNCRSPENRLALQDVTNQTESHSTH